MLLSGEKPWGTPNTVTHLLLLCDCLAPCETELRRAWWSIFVQSKGTLLYFVVLLNARLSSGTGSREGRAGLPSLQTTAEKCNTNWRWSPPLSELFQGDRWVSLAAMAADFDWIGYACLCNCSHSCIEFIILSYEFYAPVTRVLFRVIPPEFLPPHTQNMQLAIFSCSVLACLLFLSLV